MKALMVYPGFPSTFWGFKDALKFVFKKANQPPLGILTVAAMLPESWEKRLVDMNVSALRDKDLEWADIVLISAMVLQRESAAAVIERCRNAGVRTVAGGPLFTTDPGSFPDVDHLVLNEAEATLPVFLADLERGEAKRVYTSDEFPDMAETPEPLWGLLETSKYATMSVQYSRGCPFDCDFCDISVLYGRKVRTKSREQVLRELDSLYDHGWRGAVFFVDDNFIGNAARLKRDILPAIIKWMNVRRRPFSFQTQASMNLADDDELMRMMALAGFDSVFVGIETTNEESLVECGKMQNTRRDMISSVKKMQGAGLQVMAGFILGFDSDPPDIFEKIGAFVQRSGIVCAMIGLLNAPRHTRLYRRLKEEGRLLSDITGDNTDFTLNFVPRMDREALVEGYRKLLQKVYSPQAYYERVMKFLREYKPPKNSRTRITAADIGALLKSIVRLGIFGKERFYYWRPVLWASFRRPRMLPMAVTFAIYGFHFRRFFNA